MTSFNLDNFERQGMKILIAAQAWLSLYGRLRVDHAVYLPFSCH